VWTDSCPLKRWKALNQFITDGTLEIDNTGIPNSIRPSALGKRNWMFIGHPEAGERSAVIYTLLGSCRRSLASTCVADFDLLICKK
jgi:transposase